MSVMEEFLYVLLGIQVVVLGLQIVILYRLILLLKKKEVSFPHDIVIKSIIEDFSSKLTTRDEKIAELMVRLEVLEERLKTSFVKPPTLKTSVDESKVVKVEKRAISTDVTTKILEFLSEKSLTSREIRRMINKSREHTARLLKSLYDQGLVDRDSSKKPFRYIITEKGREVLSHMLS